MNATLKTHTHLFMKSRKPELLILAAGMGSRYGGVKQLDSVGPSGESIMEYSIHDAIKAGFGKVVFIIKKDLEDLLQKQIIEKYKDQIEISYVFQEVDSLPEGYNCPEERIKPWGTGHAILMAKEAMTAPFAVINADDFYGANSYPIIAEELFKKSIHDTEFCLLGYILKNTLSENGSVSRGLCTVESDYLTGLRELTSISKSDGKVTYQDGDQERSIAAESVVSMNFWGFTPKVFDILEEQFKHFLDKNIDDLKAEFYITTPLNHAVDQNRIKIKVLTTDENWLGVTYAADKPFVEQGIRKFVDQKIYPSQLFNNHSSMYYKQALAS